MNAPRPDHRHIYVLIAGILAGIFLGPGILGRFAPETYNRCFVGAGDLQQQLEQLDKKFATIQQKLRDEKVDEAAIVALTQKYQEEVKVARAMNYSDREQFFIRWQNWRAGLLMALVVIFLFETLVGENMELLQAMHWARAIISAIFLTTILAQPSVLTNLPLPLIVAVVALSVGLGLPLKKLFTKSDSEKPKIDDHP